MKKNNQYMPLRDTYKFAGNTFKIKFEDNFFNKGDILETSNGMMCKVLETPHRKWWRQLLYYITFGLVDVRTWEYKVEPVVKVDNDLVIITNDITIEDIKQQPIGTRFIKIN